METGDGSLPDIFVEGLSGDEIVALYEWLMQRCSIYGEPLLWSLKEQRDMPIRQVPNPARACVRGEVEGFRHGLANLSVHGKNLMDMTVRIEEDGLSFDYRKGQAWNEATVGALFELLRQLRGLAPSARFVQADEGGYDQPNVEFAEALYEYINQSAPQARVAGRPKTPLSPQNGIESHEPRPSSRHPGLPLVHLRGSRDLDRILDRQLTFLEILGWQEDAETMSLFMQEQREKRAAAKAASETAPPAVASQ